MLDYFSNTDLLKTPSKRAAYSDRTSYVMAEMSRLAYFKFEGGSNIDELLESARTLIPEGTDISAFEVLIKSSVVSDSPEKGEEILRSILTKHDFELVSTYSDTGSGAQAFLCSCDMQKLAILAFRGTEPSLKDIKADVKANLVEEKNANGKFLIHSGYLGQFKSLEHKIRSDLESGALDGLQLFITGHSLGGALAITAVKFLASDITGACYTFGSPPVGTKDFDRDIKTPIYRIVNHVDIVPRLPNPILVYVVRLFAMAVDLLLSPFAGFSSTIKESDWYKKIRKALLDAQKYRQSGYGSFLVGEGSDARLRYNVSMFDRIVWWIKQFKNIFRGDFKILSDHSIDEYSRKLAVWAENRK